MSKSWALKLTRCIYCRFHIDRIETVFKEGERYKVLACLECRNALRFYVGNTELCKLKFLYRHYRERYGNGRSAVREILAGDLPYADKQSQIHAWARGEAKLRGLRLSMPRHELMEALKANNDEIVGFNPRRSS